MTYCTATNMIDRFSENELVQLTDVNNLGVIDNTVLNAAIKDATDEINIYLAKYSQPLFPIPAVLTKICCHIARYNLYDDAAPDRVIQLYKDAVSFLTKVSTGKVSLGVSDSGEAVNTSGSVEFSSSPAVFGR